MVLKVNEFERALDEYGTRAALLDRDSNIQYVSNSLEDIFNGETLLKFIRHHHSRQKPRLQILQNYYEGKTVNRTMRQRRIEEDRADHRISHPFAEYISDFTNGYFLGKPIRVNFENDNENLKRDVNDKLNEVLQYNDMDSINRLIGLDLSVYGRAYEIVTKNDKDEYRVYRMKPEETFIIYDNSIEVNSLCAVNYYPLDTVIDSETTYAVDVYTNAHIYHYEVQLDTESNLKETDHEEEHFFGRVPITELSNNKDRRGDFEKVISLIDLYDASQADTANYMTDLNDAMLVIAGQLNVSIEELREMKQANILYLEPSVSQDNSTGNERVISNADAKYIYKQYDASGVESYKERLANDIHTLTNTPNMTDAHFSGNASGEAMKYKLFGLEQKTVIKEGMFLKGLRRRFKLLQTIMQMDRYVDAGVDFKDLEYTFVRNTPKSVTEDLQAFTNAGGRLSQETLLNLFGFSEDTQAELDRIQNEQPKTLDLYDWQTDDKVTDDKTVNEVDDVNEEE